jgi:hypothetical protein
MIRIKQESISMERLDGETILIDFNSGKYYSFVGPSADILWLLEQGVPEDSWVSILARSYKGLKADTHFWEANRNFISELLVEGVLIETLEVIESGITDLPEDHVRGAWSFPKIQVNDELEDLLVIDPIHESDEDGWPHAKQG